MARHARSVARPVRTIRIVVLVLVWLTGLAAGMYALASIGARYTTCTASSHGFACRDAGSVSAGALAVVVVATVTAVSVLSHDRPRRTVLALSAAGVAVLLGCIALGYALLRTA